MMDPDGLQIQSDNLSNIFKIKEVPEFDFQCYNLEDDKDYEKYIKDIENAVRKSFEYKAFVKYLRENMDMNKCSFLKGVTNEESFDIKIELHHYPFTLRDIVEIVFRKRNYFNESLDVNMVAKEVMELHYKMIVGIIPLSETVHELVHAGRLFIPVDKVMGRYNYFVEFYKQFIDPDKIDILERIEKYTFENSSILDTTIIEQNRITYEVNNDRFALPDFSNINENMQNRLESIKNNIYSLPDKEIKKKPVCPIEFF